MTEIFGPLTSLVTLFVTLSVAVERVIEILKGIVPVLVTPRPTERGEYRRGAVMHMLSAAIGGFISWGGHIDLFKRVTGDPSGGASLVIVYVILGFLASGGSAFWNHILDIVKASKIKNETAANQATKTAGFTNPIPT